MLELKEIMKTIHKTMVKRNHKMIDYDRHRTALNKLKAKEERSFSEEKQIFKVNVTKGSIDQNSNQGVVIIRWRISWKQQHKITNTWTIC